MEENRWLKLRQQQIFNGIINESIKKEITQNRKRKKLERKLEKGKEWKKELYTKNMNRGRMRERELIMWQWWNIFV